MSPGHAGPYHQVVKRLMARVAMLPPRVQDLALALALTIFDVAAVLPYQSQLHPFGLALALVIAQSVPLIWRRSWPVPVLLASAAARITYDALGFGYAPFQVATTLAFFTVMERCSPLVRRITVVLTVAGSTISQLSPGHSQPYDATVSAFVSLPAWAAAVLSRTRRAYIQGVEDRAARAGSERDDGAKAFKVENVGRPTPSGLSAVTQYGNGGGQNLPTGHRRRSTLSGVGSRAGHANFASIRPYVTPVTDADLRLGTISTLDRKSTRLNSSHLG